MPSGNNPASGAAEQQKPEKIPHEPARYFFFVDDTKYETDQASLTGAAIKAMVPGFDRTYSLFLEVPGDAPDQLITDETSILLEKDKGPKRFHSVPPATFGTSR